MKFNIARRIALSMGVMLVLFFGTTIVGYILITKVEQHLKSMSDMTSMREVRLMKLTIAQADYANAILDGLNFSRENAEKRKQAAALYADATNTLRLGAEGTEGSGLKSELTERFLTLETTGSSLLETGRDAQNELNGIFRNVAKLVKSTEEIVLAANIADGGESLFQRTARAMDAWYAAMASDTIDPWQSASLAPSKAAGARLGPIQIIDRFIAALPIASASKLSNEVSALRRLAQTVGDGGAKLSKINMDRVKQQRIFLQQSGELSGLLKSDALRSGQKKAGDLMTLPKFFTDESATFLMLMVAIGGIIGAAAGLVLIRGIISPVQSLSKQISSVDGGNLTEPIDVDGDEGLQQIAQSFNHLVEQKNATEAALEDLTHHDPLTHLPNREHFLSRLEEAAENAQRVGRLAAVQMLDIDGLKNINDGMGHDVGDKLLILVSERLKECVRGTDLVARMGGDEFAIIQTNLNIADQTHFVADRVIKSMSDEFTIGAHSIKIGASVGIAVYPADGMQPGELLQNAEVALKQAKESGRGTYQLYDPKLDEELRRRRELEKDIRQALDDNEFYLCYQPRMDAAKREIIGAEALIRWNSSKRGLVRPDEFISIAEASGDIIYITDFVLRDVCRQLASWNEKGMRRITISLNLSPLDFHRDDLVETISEALALYELPASQLELEITEGMVMFGVDEVNERLDKLRELGVRLAIDDFGTGYSSMSYLKQFNVDTLKIDRSFVDGIPDNREDIGITMAIIRMAHSLNLQVVAEGVETEEQFEFLRRRKCDEIQGYLFAPPLEVPDFEEFVNGTNMPAAGNG